MDLKDRLARLNRSVQASQPEPKPEPVREEWVERVQRELQLDIVAEQGIFFFLKERTYPLFEKSYYQQLWDQGLVIRDAGGLICDEVTEIPLRQVLFLDLETTGLSGGAGTLAFLIGLAFLELDHIVVRQYLLPDFNHEFLMLKQLNGLLQGYRFTASFNGKTFDLPLLRTRFLLNRLEACLDDLVHLDFLHAARRIWRERLTTCNLQNLEREILSVNRKGDIPGSLIPQLYFDFLRRRDLWALEDVLEHNYQDMVNMVLLALHIGAIASNPVTHLNHPLDRCCLAHFYFQKRQWHLSAALLEHFLNTPGNTPLEKKLQAYFLRAMVAKKLNRAEESTQFLWRILEQQHYHPRVVEELAKFYEHRERNFQLAHAIVFRGLRAIELRRQLNPEDPWTRFQPALEHRLNRLHRRLHREEAESAP